MELRFDFAEDDSTTGFRLDHFEFYNWGTYDKKIVKLDLSKKNALLTGDIGSGKSTIVDALTTLLVPHQKITFNKAAGAQSKERSIYSYVLGEYKSTKDENFGHSKAVSLRDESSFSVILGRFENIGYEESLVLAQFFYIVNGKVEKFFIVSKSELSIKKDFFDFDDIRSLKKRLRELAHTNLYDTFKDYSKDFRRVMGIKNEQALNLFYQTVSLKSIGNLTEFIRLHMLESNEIDQKVEELCLNFAELNHTHDLVLRAKKQIELLKPISSGYKKYKIAEEEKNSFEITRNSLNFYFSMFEYELLEEKLKELILDLTKNRSNKQLCDEEYEKLNDELIKLKIELEKNGGNRINQIENDIKQLSHTLIDTKKEHETYNNLVKKLDFEVVSNEHRFLKTQDEVKDRFESIDEEKTRCENSIIENTTAVQRYKEYKEELEVEVTYLQNNRSNIPHRISSIRDNMAKELGIDVSKLPFVGELISVKDEDWEGAIERVLHSFALSLLVDSDIYDEVSDYVDKTNLKGKLVYLKINSSKKYEGYTDFSKDSMLQKIEVKVDSDYFVALNSMLYERFNIPCVDNLNDFRRFKKALSINGQFKTNLIRHEKDDRHNLNDRSRWVLGWDNVSKLKEFTNNLIKLNEKIDFLKEKIDSVHVEKKEIEQTIYILRDILKYESFQKINWYRYSKEIDFLNEEKKLLEQSSDIIKTLKESISTVNIKQKEQKAKSDRLSQKIGELIQKIDNREIEKNRCQLVLDNGEIEEGIKVKLDSLKEETLTNSLNLINIKSSQINLREKIQKEIDKLGKIIQKLSEKIISDMGKFINTFPVIAKEFDAHIDSGDEFDKKLQELKKDNLPKWQKKFKELFKEKTIQNIVILQSSLEQHSSEIKTKIDTINKSLKDIEYSDGTYIELIANISNISDIKEFKQKLKSVTTGAISEDNIYDEQKFLEIKEIIDRFNGREGYSDIDKKWRKLVTDVRNWFDFSAIEKYISDESVREYYAHSGGKSGGQKEKLAYTVLASSLAYQFGLEHNKIQSRSFRFVMIDEAFGRGSDESSRYALRLFEKLKLQLLVITPKQKINVIEPYVKTVHFVHNQDGMDSSLISMQIEEYQKNKKK